MKNATLLPILLGTACLAPPALYGSRGVLNADGILLVKGADASTAMITVVPENAAAYSLAAGTKRFVLNLPVNDTYLVSFMREGCPTKEVYFDTRVPVERTADAFSFPFQVTLEHMRADRMFAYDGPVGFVRYQHPVLDFGYETQYVVKVNQELHDRMREMESTGTDPKIIQAPTAAMVVDIPRGGGEPIVKMAAPSLEATTASSPENTTASGPESTTAPAPEGTTAPKVSEVPKLVHTLAGPMHPVAMAQAEANIPGPDHAEQPSIAMAPAVSDATAPQPERSARIDAVAPAIAGHPLGRDRQEEVLVDERMVIRIVRFIRPDGTVTDELRKVSHSYGAVFYFHNMQSITERAFLELTAGK
jgi:hypothetical protein